MFVSKLASSSKNTGASAAIKQEPDPTISYCLYARKSMEDEERQALSIDQQTKEMHDLASRASLKVVAVRTEAHSAKNSGERPVFNKMLEDIKASRYNAILTWAPDRLSRNAGDLGRLVDLMDNKLLLEVRTCNQTFSNSPNEKFLLMILGSQAKLENDNKSLNVKRGLRAVVERGLWPCSAPLGYLNEERRDLACHVRVDPARAIVIKTMFRRAADGQSSRHIRRWLREELHFLSPNGKLLSLSTVQKILRTPFYYGEFEYPKGSGCWYKGKHVPLISKETFEAVQKQIRLRVSGPKVFRRIFAFTKFMKCGLCGSGITAQERFKSLKDGSISKYVYYGCTRSRDQFCKLRYMREEELIRQLCGLVDRLSLDDLGIRDQIEVEAARYSRFQEDVVGSQIDRERHDQKEIDIKKYVKYLLSSGTIEEKRMILNNLQSRLIMREGRVILDDEEALELRLAGHQDGQIVAA